MEQRKISRTAVLRPRSCETCASVFHSRSSKKRFCDTCMRERERKQGREAAAAKARNAGVRKIGDTANCMACGRAFVLDVGPAKNCAPCRKGRQAKWHRDRRKIDAKRNISERMSRAINASLAAGKGGRGWQQLVDYSLEDLMRHLERQFLPRMGWDNRSLWHIDHIVPVSAFDILRPGDSAFRAAWALTNLRPMWARENQRKSDKRTHLI